MISEKGSVVKKRKRMLALAAAFALCFAMSITAMAAWGNRQTVTLTYPATDKSMIQYGGVAGQGTGNNYKNSTVPMNYYFKSSNGSGWTIGESRLVANGASWFSSIYRAKSGDNLFRVDMMSQIPAYPTTVYWKATGTVRTDK